MKHFSLQSRSSGATIVALTRQLSLITHSANFPVIAALLLLLLPHLAAAAPPDTSTPTQPLLSGFADRSSKCPVNLEPQPPVRLLHHGNRMPNSPHRLRSSDSDEKRVKFHRLFRELTTNNHPLLSSRSSSSPPGTPQPRIINGDESGSDLASYVALLSNGRGLGGCTGTVVGPKLIISAAHCAGLDYAFVGSTLGGLGERMEIDEWLIDTSWEPTDETSNPKNYWYDFALVTLVEEIPSSAGVKYMQISANSSVPSDATWARVAGFGTLTQGESSNDDLRLYQVDVPVYNFQACKRKYEAELENINMVITRQVCAGYDAGGCDSCQGDSGGPLIQYDTAGKPVLVAVVSFGIGCGKPGFPGVYVRTATYKSDLERYNVPSSSLVQKVDEVPANLGGGPSIIVIAVAVAAVVVVGVVVAIIIWCCCCRNPKVKEPPVTASTGPVLAQQPTPPISQPASVPAPMTAPPEAAQGTETAAPSMSDESGPPQPISSGSLPVAGPAAPYSDVAYAPTQPVSQGMGLHMNAGYGMGMVPPPPPPPSSQPISQGMPMTGMGLDMGMGMRPDQTSTLPIAPPPPPMAPPPMAPPPMASPPIASPPLPPSGPLPALPSSPQ